MFPEIRRLSQTNGPINKLYEARELCKDFNYRSEHTILHALTSFKKLEKKWTMKMKQKGNCVG